MRFMPFFVALALGAMLASPALAQYAWLRPLGAVPMLDGCNGYAGYPDCHPDRLPPLTGRSVAGPAGPGTVRAVVPPPAYYPGYPAYGR